MSVEDLTTPQSVISTPRLEAARNETAPADRPVDHEPPSAHPPSLAVLHRPAHLLLLEEVVDWWHAHPSPFRLLDLSCGTDAFIQRLKQCPLSATTTSIDPFRPTTDLASPVRPKPNPSTSPLIADGEQLSFPDETFDVVTCAVTFHGYANQQAGVHEMRRVLRRDGRLIIVDGFRDNLVGHLVYDVVMRPSTRGEGYPSWTAMRDYLARAGFRHVRHRKSGLLLPLLATIGDVE